MTQSNDMPEISFVMKHGRNTSDRLVPELLKAIGEKLSEGIILNGQLLKVEPLCEPTERDGQYSLLFDVKEIAGFDHIEFKITKTGWGR